MAATGLLGINPYQKGVAIDISSKPINLAMQLQQKEEAKKEALDKYFMDYEKSLNPAGMRGQDQDVFLNGLGEAKQYYLQNNKEILNPAKYGSEKQSEYMAKLKKAQSIIDQSKQAAANEKVDREHYYQAQKEGLDVPDGYLQDVERSHLPLNHPQYQPLDAYKYNFTKPFDEGAFSRTLTNGLTPSINKELSSEKPDNKGYINRTTTYEFNPLDKQQIKNRAELSYGHIPGVTNMTNKIIKSGEYLNYQKQFGELYPGQDITTAKPQQIAAAVGLSITPHGKTINDQIEDKQYWLNKQEEKQIKGYWATTGAKTKQDIDAEVASNKNYLTDLVDNANKNQVLINNPKSKKNELWGVVPLSGDQIKLFPQAETVTTTKDGQPISYTKQKTPDAVLVDPNGNFHRYYKKLDPVTGKELGHELGVEEIPAKEIARVGITPTSTAKHRGLSIDAALNEHANRYNTIDINKTAYSATGANNEKIYSNDGKNWYNKQGKKI